MFGIDSLTQLLYLASIIVAYAQPLATFDAVSTVPYIAGSVFTLLFSFLIVLQFYYYKIFGKDKTSKRSMM